MKKYGKALGLSIVNVLVFWGVTFSEVITYPAPQNGIPLGNDKFSVTADGKQVDVYFVAVSNRGTRWANPQPYPSARAGFALFDFSGSVTISISRNIPFTSAAVLPASRGIKPQISGQTITFTISNPGQFCIKFNNDLWNTPLYIFANPLETNVPSKTDTNVVYFGPGVHNLTPASPKLYVPDYYITSGKTIYLAGGAVVYGCFESRTGTKNISIRGRGIFCGSKRNEGNQQFQLLLKKVNGIYVEGITIYDSKNWNLAVSSSENILIDNVKIIGYDSNSDGIDICNSSNAEIKNCFIRSFDDCIAMKGVKYFDSDKLPLQNVKVTNCVLWNDWNVPVELGAEGFFTYARNINVSNIDIIYDSFQGPALRVNYTGWSGDDAQKGPVKNVLFENIRIEESDGGFIELTGADVIDSVRFKNIAFPKTDGSISIGGTVKTIVLENVMRGGVYIKTNNDHRIYPAGKAQVITTSAINKKPHIKIQKILNRNKVENGFGLSGKIMIDKEQIRKSSSVVVNKNSMNVLFDK